MTGTLSLHGYQPVADQAPVDTTINISGCFDEKSDTEAGWEGRAREKFVNEAKLLYEALSNSLPGGTMHELLICMLAGKQNLLIVKDTRGPEWIV